MKDVKGVEIEDVVKDMTIKSAAYHGYGYSSRLPIDEDSSRVFKESCQNDSCRGDSIQFEHLVDKYENADAYKDDLEYVFSWDSSLESFKLTGYICPICGKCKVKIDDRVVYRNEGGMKDERKT